MNDMETTLVVRPAPQFVLVLREPGLRGDIWCVGSGSRVWVGQSVPAIARGLSHKSGDVVWASSLYRRQNRAFTCRRLGTVRELNEMLAELAEVTFVVRDPDCWVISTCNEYNEYNE